MRSFFLVTFFLKLAAANKTLEEAYGPVDHVSSILPWARRSATRDMMYSEDYYKVRIPENCIFPLEVVILQDSTASFQDDFALMRDMQLKLMTDALTSSHPGSKFAVVSFRDKPVWSLGGPSDYCQRFEAPLSSDLDSLTAVYDRLVSTGGADPAENQFGALVAASQSQTPGWSPQESTSTRLIVMSTDAYPHFADDGLNTYGMTPFTGVFDESNAESQCLKEYYPSPEQMKSALIGRQAYLAQLIFDGDWNNGLVRRSWEWVNGFLGQTPDFIEPLANDSSNFWTSLAKIIKKIESTECEPQITTTTSTTTLTTKTVSTTPEEEITPVGTTETTTAAMTSTKTIPPLTRTTTMTTPATVTTVTTTMGTDTTMATTTLPPVSCPACPPCTSEPCTPCSSPCDDSEVLIKVAHRPKNLQLIINNEEQDI